MALYTLPKRYHPDFSSPNKKPTDPVEVEDYYRPLRGLWLCNKLPLANIARFVNSELIDTGQSIVSNNLRSTASGGIDTKTTQSAITGDSNYVWHIKYILHTAGGNSVIFGNRSEGVQSPLQFLKFKANGFEYFNAGVFASFNWTETLNTEISRTIVKLGNLFSYYENGELVSTVSTSVSMDENPIYISVGGLAGGEATDTTTINAMHGPLAPSAARVRTLATDFYNETMKPSAPPIYFTASAVVGINIPVIMHSYKQRRV